MLQHLATIMLLRLALPQLFMIFVIAIGTMVVIVAIRKVVMIKTGFVIVIRQGTKIASSSSFKGSFLLSHSLFRRHSS